MICEQCRPNRAGYVQLCPLHEAAPDLLEACKAIRAVDTAEVINYGRQLEAAIGLAKIAIEKAEGPPPPTPEREG